MYRLHCRWAGSTCAELRRLRKSITYREKQLYDIVFITVKEMIYNEIIRTVWISRRKLQFLSLVTAILEVLNVKNSRARGCSALAWNPASPLTPSGMIEVFPKTTLCFVNLSFIWERDCLCVSLYCACVCFFFKEIDREIERGRIGNWARLFSWFWWRICVSFLS